MCKQLTVLVIELPIPFHEQSQNARVHWSKKAPTTKTSRKVAKLLAMDAMNRMRVWEPPRWEQAETMAVFYFETNRRRDRDNYGAMLKPYWDGIADAEVIENDSGFIHHPPELLVDKEKPRVVLTIRKIEPSPVRQ